MPQVSKGANRKRARQSGLLRLRAGGRGGRAGATATKTLADDSKEGSLHVSWCSKTCHSSRVVSCRKYNAAPISIIDPLFEPHLRLIRRPRPQFRRAPPLLRHRVSAPRRGRLGRTNDGGRRAGRRPRGRARLVPPPLAVGGAPRSPSATGGVSSPQRLVASCSTSLPLPSSAG